MSLISLVYNFGTHEEAIAFLQKNPIAAAATGTATPSPAPAPTATKTRTTKAKSFGPAVEGDPEGTRYFHHSGDNRLWKTPAGDGPMTAVEGATEISGVDYLAKKAALAQAEVDKSKGAAQAPAASPASATETAGAADPSGSDGDFDPFADGAADDVLTDVTVEALTDKLKALSQVKDGRTKLVQVLTEFGDGKSVPVMLKAADTPAKRVAIFNKADSLMK